MQEKPIPWALILARIKYWGWWIGSKLLVLPLYVTLVAEGARLILPGAAIRLHTIPIFSELKNYQGTYKLDCAILAALLILIGVLYFSQHMLRVWLIEHDPDTRWRMDRKTVFVTVCGSVTVFLDLVCFYLGVCESSWGGSVVSFKALLGTALYGAILAFVAFVSVNLSQTIEDLKEKETNHASQSFPHIDTSERRLRMRRETAAVGNGASGG